MRIVNLTFTYLIYLLSFISSNTLAHSGRLDANGCHGGSQPYHCHRAASEIVSSSAGGSRLTCAAGSRSKDCNNVGVSASKLSFSASTSNSNYATQSQKNHFYKSGSSFWVKANEYNNVYMNLYPSNDRKKLGLAVNLPISMCKKFEDYTKESNLNIVISGNEMPVYIQCTGRELGNLYPQKISDQKELVRLFKQMKQVNLSIDNLSLSFSAMGFTKAYEKMTASLIYD